MQNTRVAEIRPRSKIKGVVLAALECYAHSARSELQVCGGMKALLLIVRRCFSSYNERMLPIVQAFVEGKGYGLMGLDRRSTEMGSRNRLTCWNSTRLVLAYSLASKPHSLLLSKGGFSQPVPNSQRSSLHAYNRATPLLKTSNMGIDVHWKDLALKLTI